MDNFKKQIEEISKFKGRHTELVSVYIPADSNLVEIVNMLNQEKSTAENIKSKATRKNVLAALEKIIQNLKQIKDLPENGLAIFCGNVSQKEGKTDIRIWLIEPPEKMKIKIYWCDQKFRVEPLLEMLKPKETFGLIVLDAKEATIGLLAGKRIEKLKYLESNVPSKVVKGGMSQARYDRIREGAINDFLNKIGEVASSLLLNQPKLRGIIIGGPGPIKEKFVKEEYLDYRLRRILLGIKDVSYSDEYGLEELVKRSEDLLREAEITKEKKILEEFFKRVQNNQNVSHKIEEIEKYLEIGSVEKILISEKFNTKKFFLTCKNNHKYVEYSSLKPKTCKICNEKVEIKEEDLKKKILDFAEDKNIEVINISTSTNEGNQFLKIGGIGAFLKYKIEL